MQDRMKPVLLNALPIAVLAFGLIFGVFLVKLYNHRQKSQYKFYSLTFPSQLKAEQVTDWLASVASTFAKSSILPSARETIVIELRSDARGLTHRLGVPWQHVELIGQLRAHVEGVHVVEHVLESVPEWSHAEEVGMNDSTKSLDVSRIEATVKSVLTAATEELKADDVVAVQLVISAVGRIRSSEQALVPWNWRALVGTPSMKHEDAQRLTKQAENQFKVVMRLVSYAETLPHAKKLVSNMRNAYKTINNSTAYLTATLTPHWLIKDNMNHAAPPLFYPAQVSASELAALSAFPIGSPVVPGLTLGRTRYLPPNETIARAGRKLGNSVYETFNKRPIAITAEDACRHMYVIGPSGFGKTTLLTNTLQQDIENGYGAVVIESKGDLFRAALETVPYDRLGDVIVMNLTDSEYAVGLNLLQDGGGNIVDDLTKLFSSGNADIYLRDIMYHGLHTLRHDKDFTLIDLLPFLQPRTPMEKAWRDNLIESLPRGGEFYQYWKYFDTLKVTEQRQRIQPVANRMWELTNRRDVRNMLGQSKSTINLRHVMQNNKLLFIYVPDSIGDDTVSLLTSLIFKASWDAVRSVKKELPTYMYFDEVQKLRGLVDLEETLSLARSYKLGLVMAHQYTDQLPPKLFSAITNASTQVAFKLDGPDAHKMTGLFGKSVTPEDFQNLEPYEVIARVATPGGSSQPTVVKTYAPFKPHGFGQEVIRRSRAQFSRKAEDVDKEIIRRRSAPMKPAKAKPSFGDMTREGDE